MKNNCKRYAQAITDSVLGEEIDMPKEELMGHLKECAKCRQEATNWQDFQDALRVKEYHARPEVKEKWDRFIKELTSPAPRSDSVVPRPVGVPTFVSGTQSGARVEPVATDVKVEIGLAAVTIYDYLKNNVNGPISYPEIRDKTHLVNYPFYEAMSWLVMNERVSLTKDKDNRPAYASLSRME